MGKYLSVIIGALVMILGVMGLIRWHIALLTVLKGMIPALLILGGAIAVIAGISEIKDETTSKTEEKKEEKK